MRRKRKAHTIGAGLEKKMFAKRGGMKYKKRGKGIYPKLPTEVPTTSTRIRRFSLRSSSLR